MTMTSKFAVLLVVLCGACAPALPQGHELPGQEVAIEFVLAYYGAATPHRLPVEFVTPDCVMADSGRLVGFTNPADGGCYTGLTIPGEVVYVSAGFDHLWESAFGHELMHSLVDDQGHTNATAWGAPDEQIYSAPGLNGYGGQVAAVMTALKLHPELDLLGGRK